jgi:hypothetical protein
VVTVYRAFDALRISGVLFVLLDLIAAWLLKKITEMLVERRRRLRIVEAGRLSKKTDETVEPPDVTDFSPKLVSAVYLYLLIL